MYFKRKKNDSPRSDLRSRLDEYSSLREKTWWWGEEENTGADTIFDYFPFSVFKDMHSFMLLKITAGLLIVLLVTFLTLVKLPLTVALLEKIQYITTWKTDFAALGRETAPVIKKLWSGNLEADLERFVLAPGADFSSGREEEELLAPLEGELVKTFGFRFNTLLQREEMLYGLVFTVPEGSVVQAAASGCVQKIDTHPDYGLTLLLDHPVQKETMYGYLQEALVKEGDEVRQGQEIARTGREPLGNQPAFYFEVRENGEPVDPLPLLVRP